MKKRHIIGAIAAGAALAGAVTLASPKCHSVNGLPDPVCTPGVANSQVTQANIQSTICVKGFTGTIRPSVSYTNKIKAQSYIDYGVKPGTVGELDHLISLELGGSPDDPKNLWIEVGSIPNPKDKVENQLHKEVCEGKITLKQAQECISKDWRVCK